MKMAKNKNKNSNVTNKSNKQVSNKKNNQVTDCKSKMNSNDQNIGFESEDHSFEYDENSDHSFELRNCK